MRQRFRRYTKESTGKLLGSESCHLIPYVENAVKSEPRLLMSGIKKGELSDIPVSRILLTGPEVADMRARSLRIMETVKFLGKSNGQLNGQLSVLWWKLRARII